MKALISGQAGLAIVKEGRQFSLLSHETSLKLVQVTQNDVESYLRNLEDLTEIDASSEEELCNELVIRESSDRALQLALIVLDREEPLDFRCEAAECLTELFSTDGVVTHVANILYSAPMPDSAELENAISICNKDTVTHELFEELLDSQPEILERWNAWHELPIGLFGSAEAKQNFRLIAIEEGAFRLFVQQSEKGDWTLYQMLTRPKFRGNPTARNVFQEWHKPFRSSFTPDRTVFAENDIDQSENEIQVPISSHEAFKNAKKQRNTIKQLLAKNRLQQALQFTDELIHSQRRNSMPEHIAKSLCDLAQFAKECGSPELQLTFAKLATQEAPQDAWSYATLGDAYRGVTEYTAAMDAFQKSISFGDYLAGIHGRAEVFKDLGQIDEALETLKSCLREYPDDLVAANSMAATLAEFGRFDESLKYYDKLLENNPYDLVTRSGRAQVLRVIGRLPEALDELNEIVEQFPHEIIPSCNRIEVIKEIGNLENAEFEMRTLIDRFPDNPAPRIGRAKILRDLGRFDDALKAYDEAIRYHPLEMMGLTGKADTYRKMGELELAKTTYQKVIKRIESIRYVRYGLATVLGAQGDYDAALALLPDNLPATKSEWVAYHIRGMISLRRGDFKKARKTMEWGVKECPWMDQREYFSAALATCRIREGRLEEAIECVKQVTSISVVPASLAIGMHAYAELGDNKGYNRFYDAIPTTASPFILRLRDSIHTHYRSTEDSSISTEQIFTAECDSLLIAA